MRYTGTILGIIFLLAVVIFNHKTPEKPPECEETAEARVNSDDRFNIVYCKDNGLVWHDSTWVEPTPFEERMIRSSVLDE